MELGVFYGVGIGPGDPELLTLKAVKVLQNAGAIYAPKASTKGISLARSIIAPLLGDESEVKEMVFPMTRDESELRLRWTEAASQVIEQLNAGRDVAFVTLGDPVLYSTFTYCADAVKRILPESEIRIIPGISSITASAAAAEMPLAIGDEKIAVVPCPEDIAELRDLTKSFDTVVIMKIGSQLPRLLGELKQLGIAEKASLVQRATLPDEHVYNKSDLISEADALEAGYLSIMIIRSRPVGV